MSLQMDSRVGFDDFETRHDEMHSSIDEWLDDLATLTDEARASQQFQDWLDVQSRFHHYSHRNTLLIHLQRPDATRVAGYNTWQSEFDRHIQGGENAIWIWAPIITTCCPKCHNSPSYHENSDCEYDETPPEEWSRGLVGFKPTAVFDVAQTEGEPLPKLETEATGEADGLVPALIDAADDLGVTVEIVDAGEWEHGEAMGICRYQYAAEKHPIVKAKARANQADLAVTLVHEYAHAVLHSGVDAESERAKREVEAEAVGYMVGRYFGLDTSGSAFYLAAWQDDDTEALQDRLGRISSTAETVIETIDESYPSQ